MSDVLDFAIALGRSAGWIARDRVLARALARREGIPRGVEGITPEWLSQALNETIPGVRVASVEPRGGHAGTTLRQRLAVRYASTDSDARAPEQLFLKITPTTFGSRLFGGLMDLGRTEVRFYREICAAVPVPTPTAYVARAAGHGGRFVILLEDLVSRGCEFPPESLGPDHARSVIRTLARLHAGFWESPRLNRDWAWMKSPSNRPLAAIERLICSRSQEPAVRRHGEVLSESVRERSGLVNQHREVLERYWSRGPQTLIHGDSHMGNMYFDEGEAGLLDWQVVQQGQGIRDVSYFMTNSLETDMRRKLEPELLDLYVESLAENGVTGEGLDRDLLLERYRSHILYTWFSSTVTAATTGLQPEFIARAAMQRTGSALDDHDCLTLLEELVDRGRGSGG